MHLRRLLNVFILILGFVALTVSIPANYAIALDSGTVTPTLNSTLPARWPTIGVNNAAQIKPLATLESEDQHAWIEGIAFSPDSTLLATVDHRGTVIIWNARTASKLALLKPLEDVGFSNRNQVCFSPDGTLLVSSNSPDILIWDVKTVLANPKPTPKTKLKGHKNGVIGILFSPDGTLLASSDGTQNPDKTSTVRLWQVASGQTLMTTNMLGYGACCLRFDSDGNTFYWAENEVTHVWSIKNQKEVEVMKGYWPLLSPDGSTKVSWIDKADDPFRYALQLQDAKTGKVKFTLQRDEGPPIGRIIAFSPDSTILATADAGEGGYGIDLWEVATGKLLTTVRGAGAVTSLAFSPDGTLLADGQDGAGLGIAYAHIWAVRP